MIEKFKSYFTKLERLSNDELDTSAEKLVLAENTNIAKLIAHLAEMSSRKTALELGYRSLYDYCIRRLNLSEGAVPARVQVANVCRRFPQLLVALAECRMSLTVAGLLAPHLREDNADKLISDCVGKTRRKMDEYLVALKPKPVFEPSIRKRPVAQSRQARVEAPHPDPSPSVPLPPSQPIETPKKSPTVLQAATTEVFNFRFSADREFKNKFERLAEVVGIHNAQKHMADVLEKALDIALEKKDPKKKLERRRKREKTVAARSRPDEQGQRLGPLLSDEKVTELIQEKISNHPARRSSDIHSTDISRILLSGQVSQKDEPAKSRYVASEVSERVHARDGYQCLFFGPDGTRCTDRTGLHLDHKLPFGIFRSNAEQSLRLLWSLCRYRHNGHYADYMIMPRRGRTGGGKARWARVTNARHRLQRGIIGAIGGRRRSRPRAQNLTPAGGHQTRPIRYRPRPPA